MTRYVALLRAVNVGGNQKVSMPELRDAFEAFGLRDVSTYIQSGNVIFTSDATVVTAEVESALKNRLHIDTDVILRTSTQLQEVVAHNPFEVAEPKSVHVGFMAAAPAADDVASIEIDRFFPEQAAIRATEVYFHLPNGMGRAKLPPYVLRQLRVATTVRNWNTITKLAQLAGD